MALQPGIKPPLQDDEEPSYDAMGNVTAQPNTPKTTGPDLGLGNSLLGKTVGAIGDYQVGGAKALAASMGYPAGAALDAGRGLIANMAGVKLNNPEAMTAPARDIGTQGMQQLSGAAGSVSGGLREAVAKGLGGTVIPSVATSTVKPPVVTPDKIPSVYTGNQSAAETARMNRAVPLNPVQSLRDRSGGIRTVGPDESVNLGAYGGNADITGSSSNPQGGPINAFSGTGQPGPIESYARGRSLSEINDNASRIYAEMQGSVQRLREAQGERVSSKDKAATAANILAAQQAQAGRQTSAIANQSAQLDVQGKISQMAQQKQLADLSKSILSEKDPAKRKSMYDTYLALSGKNPTQDKVVLVDSDTGQKDMMGQPIFKKVALNPVTGEFLQPEAPAKPKLSADEALNQAKDAIARGASKDAVNARLKELGHAPI